MTEKLDKEAKEMEERLKYIFVMFSCICDLDPRMLQERIQQQAQEDLAATSTGSGGTKWRGASEKASIRSYAKDVQEKHKKKVATKADPALKATAAARRETRQVNAPTSGFASKGMQY